MSGRHRALAIVLSGEGVTAPQERAAMAGLAESNTAHPWRLLNLDAHGQTPLQRGGRCDSRERRGQLASAGRAVLLAAALWSCGISDAFAQSDSPLSAARFEVGGGARWLGTTGVGGIAAEESGNGTGPVTLFRTESSLNGKVGVELRAGVKVAGPVRLETSFAYHLAELAVSATADREGAAPVTATETLRHFQFEGGVLFQPDRWRLARTRFFASGGGGYVRDLHQQKTLVEGGWTSYVGAGLLQPLTERPPRLTMIGLRLEARFVTLARAAALDDRVHGAPAAAASLFVRF
jgi:hypothetical protein